MATKLAMKKKEDLKNEFNDFSIQLKDAGSYYYGSDRYQLLYKDKPIFTYDCVQGLHCCGIGEVTGWSFPSKQTITYCEDLQKAFNALILKLKDTDGGQGSIFQFAVTRTRKTKKVVQPEWFVKCLEEAPNSYELDWMPNTNTGNTDIKLFVVYKNA